MRISENGINLIKRFEGLRLEAYRCPSGVLTIGYGHTRGVKIGDKITKQRAEELLREDLRVFESYVNDSVSLPLNQNQFDALVSFAFNCGVGNLRKLVRNRDLGQIADAIVLYNKGGGKVLKGLKKRREEERKLFCTAVGA